MSRHRDLFNLPRRRFIRGLADLVAGVRLRYEIRREFAPYIGIERAAKFGTTADYALDARGDTRQTRYVAGLRFWL